MSETVGERIAKLPMWVQDQFKKLTREREIVVRQLNDFLDDQKESPIYVQELSSHTVPPTFIKKYIQGDKIYIGGFNIRILEEEEGGGIYINGDWRIVIEPIAGNAFMLREKK